MQNCEKSILVCYINVGITDKQLAINALHQIKEYIKNAFINNSEINDESLVILVIPVQNQPTKIELLNARYPEYETIIESSEKIIKDYFDKNLNK